MRRAQRQLDACSFPLSPLPFVSSSFSFCHPCLFSQMKIVWASEFVQMMQELTQSSTHTHTQTVAVVVFIIAISIVRGHTIITIIVIICVEQAHAFTTHSHTHMHTLNATLFVEMHTGRFFLLDFHTIYNQMIASDYICWVARQHPAKKNKNSQWKLRFIASDLAVRHFHTYKLSSEHQYQFISFVLIFHYLTTFSTSRQLNKHSEREEK